MTDTTQRSSTCNSKIHSNNKVCFCCQIMMSKDKASDWLIEWLTKKDHSQRKQDTSADSGSTTMQCLDDILFIYDSVSNAGCYTGLASVCMCESFLRVYWRYQTEHSLSNSSHHFLYKNFPIHTSSSLLFSCCYNNQNWDCTVPYLISILHLKLNSTFLAGKLDFNSSWL